MAAIPTVGFDEGWAAIRMVTDRVVRRMQHPDVTRISTQDELTEMYSMAYRMAAQRETPHGGRMYDAFGDWLREYIEGHVVPLLAKAPADEGVLRELASAWQRYWHMVRWFCRIMSYVSRYHVVRHRLPSMEAVGTEKFTTHAIEPLADKLKNAFCTVVERDRASASSHLSILNEAVSILTTLRDSYVRHVEPAVVQCIRAHYVLTSAEWRATLAPEHYLKKVEETREWHRTRYLSFAARSTWPLVRDALDDVLVRDAHAWIMSHDHGVPHLFRVWDENALSMLFAHWKIDAALLADVAKAFQNDIEAVGTRSLEIGMDKFAEEFSGLYALCTDRISGTFANHEAFSAARADAFKAMCNRKVGKTEVAELLANYMHTIVTKASGSSRARASADALDADEAVRLINGALGLYQYLKDKDMFVEFCRKCFARRLLRKSDLEIEKMFVERIKAVCGSIPSSRLEMMYKDIVTADDAHQLFADARPECPVRPTVISVGTWPTYKTGGGIPAMMKPMADAFTGFYTNRFTSRKLTWMMSMGTVEVDMRVGNRPVTLTVHPLQMAVLSAFEKTDTCTRDGIIQVSFQSPEDVDRALKSFLDANLLTNTGDVYAINAAFAPKSRRMVIPMKDSPKDSPETKKVEEVVDMERQYAVDAAIVRIMKSRKQATHVELVTAVVDQTKDKFEPPVQTIKKRIESLIERDYLKRDPEKNNTYTYVA